MTDVEVTHDDGERAVRGELGHPCGHRVEEGVLLDLLRGVDLAGVHVAGDDGDDAAVDLVVGLDPAAGAVEVVRTERDSMDACLATRRQRHTRATLRGCGVVQDVPLRPQQILEVFCGCPHLLQRENVDVSGIQPVAHAFAVRGADAVGVD